MSRYIVDFITSADSHVDREPTERKQSAVSWAQCLLNANGWRETDDRYADDEWWQGYIGALRDVISSQGEP